MNKAAIITGGSRGLGGEIALELHKKSYDIGLAARSFDKKFLERFVVNGKQNRVITYNHDFSFADEVIKFCDEVKKDFTSIDLLINNAGFNTRRVEMEHFGIEEYNKLIDVNMKSPFLVTHELLPLMKKRKKGHIINIISTNALDFKKNYASYGSAKTGMLGFSRILSKECAAYDIKVTSVMPGGINTGFRPQERPNYMSPESVAKVIMQIIEFPGDVVVDEIVIKPFWEIKNQ